MRWDLVDDSNPTLALHRKLLTLRQDYPSLRYGDFRKLHSSQLFAFLRKTVSAKDTVIVVANPGKQTVKELLQLPDSKLQDRTPLVNLLQPGQELMVQAACLEVELAPHEVLVLAPDTKPRGKGYDRYDRLP